ncbi:MAG: manganese catalase family protein [Ruminococcus sp.]|nr:manganese catalase family protein [Ruminococcus sp.]
MWQYEKKLQYPVNIKNPNPKLAQFIITQLGGPDGELAASLRYLNQRYVMPYDEVKGILTDIGVSVTILHTYFCQKTACSALTVEQAIPIFKSDIQTLLYSFSLCLTYCNEV